MKKITEKALDSALEEKFKNSPEFTKWFLSKTKFSEVEVEYHWSRSDHPWGRVPFVIINPETGAEERTIKESETDILVVFQTKYGKRFALHIENKLAGGHFTKYQPELYHARAKHWMGKPKYSSYTDYEVILVAPKIFYRAHIEGSRKFDRYVSHEEISGYIPEFKK